MKIEVQVKPNSRKQNVEKLDTGSYKVHVNSPPHEGRANAAVIDLLAEFFNVPKSRIGLLRGHKGKKKIFEIAD